MKLPLITIKSPYVKPATSNNSPWPPTDGWIPGPKSGHLTAEGQSDGACHQVRVYGIRMYSERISSISSYC